MTPRNICRVLSTAFVLLVCTAALFADDDADPAWLRYTALEEKTAQSYELPPQVAILGDSVVLRTAQQELARGVGQMLGRKLQLSTRAPTGSAIVLGTFAELSKLDPRLHSSLVLGGDGYWLKRLRLQGHDSLLIIGVTDRGALYGVFKLLSKIGRRESVVALDDVQQPYAPVRWVNQWDNLDGHIERGYGGASIFFANGQVRADLSRAAEYARLLASIGINGCTVNNVNADPRTLAPSFLPQLKRIADVFRPWGVQLSISVDLSSPKALGDLDTFDPLDARVAEWWRKKVDAIYGLIPDFGGFVVKADSEGRAGPSVYGRTHADAANVIARALKLHGGVVFYRAFVYNHHLDWRDLKADRAKAAYENFHPLDGTFEDNAIVQIKYGPIDFQVREPVSPLFAGLQSTNEAIELQITQEYTGQQLHLCFLAPMWKEVLDFDMHLDVQPSSAPTRVKDIISGRAFHRPVGGFAGVANVGLDATWLGSPMAMANLYGFGRLAWDPDLSAATIIEEWTRLTFANDPVVVRTIDDMQLNSWHIYESYTGPLGAGTLTNIVGNHYDPAPQSSEENGWGQWHRADHDAIGMDRTLATGTGFIGQYPPAVQKIYETLSACPDELLLFFHHVPYTYALHSGKTVIQNVYDSHYQGAAEAQGLISQWQKLRDHVDEKRHKDVLARLEYQAGQAVVWRDVVCRWIFDLSGIPDKKRPLGTCPETADNCNH